MKKPVHYFWTALFGFVTLAWVIGGIRMVAGMARLPRLAQTTPLRDDACPAISILVPARDEAEKLPQALVTLLAQDYPSYEVVVVDDRSTDATPQLLDGFARAHKHLKVIHLTDLPAGWLGKPHALNVAYQHATGDWLVFTDADVRFAPDVLRRALALAQEKDWDHLTLLGLADLEGFWEKSVVSYFVLGFMLGTRAWAASNPRSRAYVGVGSFQLLRRSTYQTIGTHRRLAMEVVDDMKLGKLVKQGGFRSGVGIADDSIRLRWQEGVANIIRGLTKNTFAVFGYRLSRVAGTALGSFVLSILPFLALPFLSGTARLLAVLAAVAAVALHAIAAYGSRVSPLYAITHPLGAAMMIYIVLRSIVVTLWRGGVVWRGTFYPLEQLRRGSI